MKNVALVLLVSDQTIPNFLSIKTFTEADHYLFITTDLMEDNNRGNKRKWIIESSELNGEKSDKITVNAESKEDVMEQLSRFNWNQFSDIIVNITGGTKMMSLACYEFFKSKTKNIWYLPIGSKQYHLCDDSSSKRSISYNSTVEEYLSCCGIPKKGSKYSEKQPIIDENYTNLFFIKIISGEFDLEVLEKIRLLFRDNNAPLKNAIKKKDGIKLSDFEDFNYISDFLKTIQFPSIMDGNLQKSEMDYLTGGWFEEFSFHLLRRISNNLEKQFKIGVVLNPSPREKEKAMYFTNNDLDVVMLNDNMLYVIECKSGGMNDSDLFNKTVYLASALKKYFGLTVKSALFTLSLMTEIQKEKAATLGIIAIDRSIFASKDADQHVKKLLNI